MLYLHLKTCEPHTRYLTNLQKTWSFKNIFTKCLLTQSTCFAIIWTIILYNCSNTILIKNKSFRAKTYCALTQNFKTCVFLVLELKFFKKKIAVVAFKPFGEYPVFLYRGFGNFRIYGCQIRARALWHARCKRRLGLSCHNVTQLSSP
jgi:hypothetical protein